MAEKLAEQVIRRILLSYVAEGTLSEKELHERMIDAILMRPIYDTDDLDETLAEWRGRLKNPKVISHHPFIDSSMQLFAQLAHPYPDVAKRAAVAREMYPLLCATWQMPTYDLAFEDDIQKYLASGRRVR